MRAGAASADITPEPGIELAGYAARIQPSTGVHDALRLNGLFVEVDGRRLLWLNADLIGFDAPLVERIRQSLHDGVGLDPREIVLSATHTHAGPPTIELLGCGKLDSAGREYVDRLVGCAADVARRAIADAEEVELVEGRATCRVAIDRRHRDRGVREDEAVAMGFRRANGEYLAVLANYAVHPVSLNFKNREVSGDLTGVAAARARERLPGRPVVLMTNGACGDLNPPAQGGEFEPCHRFGTELGDAVVGALSWAERCDETLVSRLVPLAVEVEPMDEPAVRARAQHVRESQRERDPIWAASSLVAADQWECRMLERLPLRPMEMAAQLVDLGGRRFVCLGAEVLSKMGGEVKRLFGDRASVVGYANGNVGYLCPKETFDEGGYEPDLAFIYYGTPKIARGAFEAIVERLAGEGQPAGPTFRSPGS